MVNEPSTLYEKFWTYLESFKKNEPRNPFKKAVKEIILRESELIAKENGSSNGFKNK